MEDTLVKIEKGLTREALIDKLIDERLGNWDRSDTWEALYHGRNGYSEFPNAELEELADEWFWADPLAYRIIDADTHTVSEEDRLREINRELLNALIGAQQSLNYLAPEKFDDAEHEAAWREKMANIERVIAKAEGRA